MTDFKIVTDIKDENNFPHIGWASEGVCFLLKDYKLKLEIHSVAHTLTIKSKAFEYDGLTARKVASVLQIEEGRTTPAWLVHDTLYMSEGDIGKIVLARKQTDKLFRAMIQELGYGKTRSYIAYLAVRIFGRFNPRGYK